MTNREKETQLPITTAEAGSEQLKGLHQYHQDADKLFEALYKMRSKIKIKNQALLDDSIARARGQRDIASGLIHSLTLGIGVEISPRGNSSVVFPGLFDRFPGDEAVTGIVGACQLLDALWPSNENGSKDAAVKHDAILSLRLKETVVLKPSPNIIKAKVS